MNEQPTTNNASREAIPLQTDNQTKPLFFQRWLIIFIMLVLSGLGYIFFVKSPIEIQTDALADIYLDDQASRGVKLFQSTSNFGSHQVLVCGIGTICEDNKIFVWPYISTKFDISIPQPQLLQVPHISAAQVVGDKLWLASDSDLRIYALDGLQGADEQLADLDRSVVADFDYISDTTDSPEGGGDFSNVRFTENYITYQVGQNLFIYNVDQQILTGELSNVLAYDLGDNVIHFAQSDGSIFSTTLETGATKSLIGTWKEPVSSIWKVENGFLIEALTETGKVLYVTDTELSQTRKVLDKEIIRTKVLRAEPLMVALETESDLLIYNTQNINTDQAVVISNAQAAFTDDADGYLTVQLDYLNGNESPVISTNIVTQEGKIIARFTDDREIDQVLFYDDYLVVIIGNSIYEFPTNE